MPPCSETWLRGRVWYWGWGERGRGQIPSGQRLQQFLFEVSERGSGWASGAGQPRVASPGAPSPDQSLLQQTGACQFPTQARSVSLSGAALLGLQPPLLPQKPAPGWAVRHFQPGPLAAPGSVPRTPLQRPAGRWFPGQSQPLPAQGLSPVAGRRWGSAMGRGQNRAVGVLALQSQPSPRAQFPPTSRRWIPLDAGRPGTESPGAVCLSSRGEPRRQTVSRHGTARGPALQGRTPGQIGWSGNDEPGWLQTSPGGKRAAGCHGRQSENSHLIPDVAPRCHPGMSRGYCTPELQPQRNQCTP